jgi:tRNA G18 (ribose-2'-O)-methylase SpoU
MRKFPALAGRRGHYLIVVPAMLTPVDDPADPRLADYANLRDDRIRADEAAGRRGIFIAEGDKIVRILVCSPFPVRSIVLTPTRVDLLRDVLDALPDSTPAYIVPERTLACAVGFHYHRGVLAAGERIVRTPEDAVGRARVIVAMEDLTNAENVGAVFRNVAALAGSAAGVLISPRCCDPLYRKAVRVSMGHVLRIPWAREPDWPSGLARLRENGFRIIALTPASDAHDVRELDPPRRLALLLGAEGAGLTPGARQAADLCVRIPMEEGVDSLNVATACAVALSWLNRCF